MKVKPKSKSTSRQKPKLKSKLWLRSKTSCCALSNDTKLMVTSLRTLTTFGSHEVCRIICLNSSCWALLFDTNLGGPISFCHWEPLTTLRSRKVCQQIISRGNLSKQTLQVQNNWIKIWLVDCQSVSNYVIVCDAVDDIVYFIVSTSNIFR